MSAPSLHHRLKVAIAVFGCIACLSPVAVHAQPEAKFLSDSHQNVSMEVGETRLMSLSKAIIRVSVADPEVADVQVVTPQQVLITAKSVGYTHLILWGNEEIPVVIAVSATRNLDQLREQFAGLFPDADIKVSSVGDLLVLSGSVTDLRLPARAAEVAKLHSEKVANLIQVTGDQQVQLDVRFAEVSRTGLRNMGVNTNWQDNLRGYRAGIFPYGAPAGAYLVDPPGGSATPAIPAPSQGNSFHLYFSTSFRQFPFSAILSILSQEGLARVLAEPTLTALSGQDAEFHSGGEVPILIARQLGTVSVQFKKFGILLNFNPTVLGERSMNLKMSMEVSEPDPSVGVSLAGFVIPGFRTRHSETTIRLRDGQSFAVAGLLSDQARSLISKVPWLGDIPLLGALFRSTQYQRQETELLMVVTAHLVRPLQPGEVPIIPGEDEYNDPSDFELFVLGNARMKKRKSYEHGRPPDNDPTSSWPFRKDATAPPQPQSAAPPQPNAAPAATTPPTTPPVAKPPTTKKNDSDQTKVAVAPHEGPIGPIGFIRD